MEEIRIYMRGHNMFDCFYGRFKKEENELLSRYVALAPREEFADILDAIDRFVYFESRKVWKPTGNMLQNAKRNTLKSNQNMVNW